MITADYIVGLTDGEGCFYVNVRPPDKRYRGSKIGIETHFYIKLREDDYSLLKEVIRRKKGKIIQHVIDLGLVLKKIFTKF